MKAGNFNNIDRKTRVLVAPLDWGLGHATRCIPIIYALLEQNCDVFIGAEGAQKELLQEEFPALSCLHLKGYRVRYSRKKNWLPLKLLLQFPKIISSIYIEHRWLKRMVKEYRFDAVISDNRFGLYHSTLPSVFITHQLCIKTGSRFSGRMAQRFNYSFINKFNACWVPDSAGENNLAGELSHPVRLPKIPVLYLGPLSRFKKTCEEKKYDLTVLISGPEPQRSIFEELLLQELEGYKGRCLVARGLPSKSIDQQINNPAIEIHDHLSTAELNAAIQSSEMVISRSGYTTVMDLALLQQKAILVPTPGQTEQEYLATMLMKKKMFYKAQQEGFSLQDVLKRLTDFSFEFPSMSQGLFKSAIENFIRSVKKA